MRYLLGIGAFAILSGSFLGAAELSFANSPQGGGLIAQPSFSLAETWQGRSQAIVRVLDRRESTTEIFTIPVGGEGAHYKSLSIKATACVQRPDGVAGDSAVQLELEDQIMRTGSSSQPIYDGWFFLKEPALNSYVSPLYAVSVVGCAGENVAPYPPPSLKKPAPKLTIMQVPQIEADPSLLNKPKAEIMNNNSGENRERSTMQQILAPPLSPHNVPRETQALAPLLSPEHDSERLSPPIAP